MPGYVVALLVLMFVSVDVIVVGAILAALKHEWNALAAKHPAVEPSPAAVRRNFQSLRLGMFNLGYSVHIAVDETHLHLFPTVIMRRMGCKPISIPWPNAKLTKARRSWAELIVGGQVVRGPAWAFGMGTPAGLAESGKAR